MNSTLMFSKASDEWSTPDDFWRVLDAEFQFDWDLAASRANAKCKRYFSRDGLYGSAWDALANDWSQILRGPGWCNPPYSQCAQFIAKAAKQAQKGCTVVCLVPARTDTRWWHAWVWSDVLHAPYPGVEIRFIKGRLKFGDGKNSAPFPSVVIVFRPVVA